MRLDYSAIRYNIEEIPEDKKVLDSGKFSDLMALADVFYNEGDVPKDVDVDKVLRYLIYMYSPNTPLKIAFPDLKIRKQFALKKINIGLDGNISDGYLQMCALNDKWIIDRFIGFTRLQKSEDYAVMHTAEQAMANVQDAILSMGSSDIKSGDFKKLKEDYESWRKTLEDARNRIMDDESSRNLRDEITYSIKSITLGIRPEEYAQEFKEKGKIFDDIIP